MPTPAVEDYLKAIYQLAEGDAAVGTSAIAERLGVAPGSVTGMLKRLGKLSLVEHERYQGARLTDTGRREAIRMIRRHRVLELFMVEILGYTWDQVHAEAERLEHAVSDGLVDRMAAVLGDPESDPHGHPIPSSAGQISVADLPTLAELQAGERGTLRRVSDEDPAALRYLARLNLIPGVRLEILERTPFEGPLRVRVGETEEMIGLELAARLRVERSA
ncbi:MAG TPA: metal-dependent transcriptional regulator [Longimicrobiales bacterium]|nr:metal-dependent transcriptional regulator [Longimicrobiales bacterium]